jgi:hypothetical protein
MRIKFRFADDSDRNEWNEIVEKTAQSEIYHTFEWVELLERTYHIKVFRLIVEADNTIVGILPFVLFTNPIVSRKIISLPFSDIGGFLLLDEYHDLSDSLVKELVKIAKKWKADFMEFRLLQENAKNLLNLNFTLGLQAFTYRLDTTKPYKEIWHNYSKKIRHNIKKMKNMGLRIREAQSEYDLYLYYNIYLKRMKDFGTPPAPFSFWRNMRNIFHPKGRMKLIFTLLDDKEIAGFTALLFKRKLYFIYNVSLTEYWKYYGLNELLFDWYIKYACENQYELVDFGRSRKSTGVQRFKEKGWGTNPIPLNKYCFFLHGKMRNPLETTLQTNNIYAKAWKTFIPTPITPLLGYLLRKNLGDI